MKAHFENHIRNKRVRVLKKKKRVHRNDDSDNYRDKQVQWQDDQDSREEQRQCSGEWN